MTNVVALLKTKARALKRHALTVYFAARDPRTPILVRALALCIAAYAFSPIDLIPDFIPVLGYLDDLVLIPLGLALVVKLVPADVMESARVRAEAAVERPTSRLAAVFIVAIWLALSFAFARWMVHAVHG
ncbi:MAG TPA: YkvA family protein [Pseudomonadales bacterium]|nr:YkvA family protein [Pseudomonadales bacterium]